jgi:hypothetical protein
MVLNQEVCSIILADGRRLDSEQEWKILDLEQGNAKDGEEIR